MFWFAKLLYFIPVSVEVISLIHVYLWNLCAAATITEGPVSRIALVGQTIQFHCAGTGNDLAWKVDGFIGNNPNVLARGISAATRILSGTAQSNLTVPATSGNNGTTVQCIVGSSSGIVFSNYSTLSVLLGIGHVGNLRFSPLLTAIMWDPSPTASVLGGLYYKLTVTNTNTSEIVIDNTTTTTTYTLPALKRCQYYTANVTAFLAEYHADSVTTKERTQGEHVIISASLKTVLNVNGLSSIGLIITLNLKLSGMLCSDQKLKFQTFPLANVSDITNHPEVVIEGSKNIVYPISMGIKSNQMYTVIIIYEGVDGVQVLNESFSTFDVQHCDVHTDNITSLLVECTFAINSTAPGFVLIQDEHSQYTINTTLQRHEGDVSKGSVNITDLPTGEYSVSVFDQLEDYQNYDSPAYVHYQPIHITSFISSTVTRDKSAVSTTAFSTPYKSPNALLHVEIRNIVIIAISITAGLIFIIIGTALLAFCIKSTVKRSGSVKEAAVTNHISVDQNQAYCIVQRIEVHNNSAYEIVSTLKASQLYSVTSDYENCVFAQQN